LALKICFISAALPDVSCGIGDYTDALACALARRDHEVVVLTTASPDLRPPSGYRAVPLQTTWSLRDAGRIAAAVRRENPEVVHLQFPGVGYGRGFGASFAPWAVRLRGQKPLLVTTLHEFHTFRLRHRARLAVAVSACDLVIAPDPAELASIQRYLRWRRGLDTAFIPVAASFWPAATAQRRAAPDREGELVIGYWGFLRPDKGVDLLLEAFVQVRRARPARLVLAGDPGPDRAYAAGLQRKAADLGLASAIQSTGRLPAEQLSAVMQSFDACVLPFRDGLSQNRTTYAGAVAHGLYVVTTGLDQRGFLPETNTTFVPPNDRDALVSAILDAPNHPRNQGMAAPEAAWDEIADLHLAAYRRAGAGPERSASQPTKSPGGP
jgi:glycosyltransferase involved in cell wall biosynthesis